MAIDPLRVHDISLPSGHTEKAVLRILLIEDDLSSQHLCKRYLDKDEDVEYELTVASSAAEGLLACQNSSFDCIILDYNLPDAKGTQVIRYLFDFFKSDSPATIIITADNSQKAAAEALRAGASDFIPKQSLSAPSLSRAIGNSVEKNQLQTAVIMQAKKLEQANQKLTRKNDEVQSFYQGVSHEVKTPLTAAREFISLVKDGVCGPINEEQIGLLNHAIQSCDQINEHFNELLEISRFDAKKIALNKELAPFDDIVKRSTTAFNQVLKAKNMTLLQDIRFPLPPILVDTNRIIQAVSNLLNNAIKFSDENTQITLSVYHDVSDASVYFSVADEGRGIAENDLKSVFERLFQSGSTVDDSAKESGGLGLGLPITKEIVEMHGGEIWVKSTLGAGSEFAFKLPISHQNSAYMERG